MDNYYPIVIFLLAGITLISAARPWRAEVKRANKTYDSHWVHRAPQERTSLYYNHPDGANITRQSHFAYEYRLGHKLTFLCVATGDPLPRITWFKDGLELNVNTHRNLMIHEWILPAKPNKSRGDEEWKRRLKSKLEIDPTTQGDQGQYACLAENKYKVDERKFKAEFINN